MIINNQQIDNVIYNNTQIDNVIQNGALIYERVQSTANVFDIFNDESALAYYRYENNANDEGNFYNATIYSDSSFIGGKIGRGINLTNKVCGLNKVSAGIYHPTPVTRNLNSFTFSAWVKGSGILLNNDYYGDVNRGYGTGWMIGTSSFNKTLSRKSKKTVTIPNWTPDVFTHLVVSVNHNGFCYIYINGVLVNSGDISGSIFYDGRHYAATGEHIGSSYASGFLGVIDEVRIIGRTVNSTEAYKLFMVAL